MNQLPSDWEHRLRNLSQTSYGQRERALFKEINPDLDHSPILQSPPSQPRPASVLIPVLKRHTGPTVLLTVRTPTMPSHAGQISFPGGGPKAGDADLIDTALREAHEEVGLPNTHVEVTGHMGHHYGGLGYVVTPVVGMVENIPEFRRCEREVAAMFEVPLAHLIALDNHIIETREMRGIKYQMFAVPYADGETVRHIWGLTAGILHTFAHAFREAGNDGR